MGWILNPACCAPGFVVLEINSGAYDRATQPAPVLLDFAGILFHFGEAAGERGNTNQWLLYC